MLALFALAMPRQAVLAALDDMEHELALIGYERMMKTAKAATTGGGGTPTFDTDEVADAKTKAATIRGGDNSQDKKRRQLISSITSTKSFYEMSHERPEPAWEYLPL